MKILMLSHSYYPSMGGELHVYHVCTELARQGQDVKVVCCDTINGHTRVPAGRELIDGVEVVREKSIYLSFLGKDTGYLSWGMLWQALRESYDLLHVHTYRFFPSWLIPLIKLVKPRVKIVFTPHLAVSQRLDFRIKLFDFILGRLIWSSCNLIIALTEIEKKFITGLGVPPEKIRVLPNGSVPIYTSEEDRHRRSKDFRSKFQIGNQSRTILFVGRVGLGKGIDVLIKAFSAIRKQGSYTLLIVGPLWDSRELFEKQIKTEGISDSVRFLGPLMGDDLKGAYLSATVFCLPSRSESLPLVIIEAMAASLPVVATKVGGIPSIVSAESGFLVDVDDVPTLGQRLESLLLDDKLASRMGKSALAVYQREYRWSTITSKLISAYRTLASLGLE